MKVLLTWYANPPDPPYWLWIKDLDGILVKLSSIPLRVLESTLRKGLKRRLGLNSTLVVDSLLGPLSSQREDRLQSWVLYVQRLLGADILVHRDYPLAFMKADKEAREKLFKRTILNAETALKLAERLGVDVMLVVQGWDVESYTRCAMQYVALGAKYIGVGSLVPKRNNREFLINVISSVREAVGRSVHIHVFGVLSPRSIVLLSKLVDSVDVSTPIRAAIAREVLVENKGELKRVHVSLIGEEGLHELMRGLPGLADIVKKSVLAREFVRSLAVYNAYVLVDWVRRVLG